MLLLTRKSQEAIRIADIVLVKVIEIRGDQVTLGIDAPREIVILREELWRRQQLAAAAAEAQVHAQSHPAVPAERLAEAG